MKIKIKLALILLPIFLMGTASQAGFKIMPHGQKQFVAKSGLSVVPGSDWNQLGRRFGRNAESWTLDGLSLNDLTFYGGIADNEALFKEVDKANRPLPHFSKTMLAPDIAQLFESSYRIAVKTSVFSIDAIEPATFAGYEGFRFKYSFVVQEEEVRRKGEATGALVDGKLFLISFEAPEILYFERDVPAYRTLTESAKIGPAPPKR